MAHPNHGLVLRNCHFLILDIFAIAVAGTLSFVIRLDFDFSPQQSEGLFLFLFLALPIQLLTLYVCGLYNRYWYNAGADDLRAVGLACALASLLTFLTVGSVYIFWSSFRSWVPISIPFIDSALLTLEIITLRFAQRAYQLQCRMLRRVDHKTSGSHILIVGTDQTGLNVLDVMEQTLPEAKIVGFLDDDARNTDTYVRGVRVLGKTDCLKSAVQQYGVTLVVIAMPTAAGPVIRKITTACQEIGVEHKIIPGVAELLSGHITVNTLRPVSIDDLLRRPPVQFDMADIQRQIVDRRVLITGGGGSIGTELARQVAQYHPKTLLLVGHGENSLFAAEARLKQEFRQVEHQMVLADVRDARRLCPIFDQFRPQIVFHTAAHKHVPMLESNVVEAVTNNVIGTNNLIDLCNSHNVDRMVMISTDKAVAPSSVMGMTKRVAEILMLNAAANCPERFAVVRFGNVLGSRGSVVPTFQQQIALGGPVTVTSDKITRYFMSIPEAARLVLKASVLTDQGPLFVLNMGEQIRIIDLARDLIRLSGLEPGRDIEVKLTGLRPGEKLYEELFWSYESHRPIEQGALFTVQFTSKTRQMMVWLSGQIHLLIRAARDHNTDTVAEMLSAIVFMSPDAPRLSYPVKTLQRQPGSSAQVAGL